MDGFIILVSKFNREACFLSTSLWVYSLFWEKGGKSFPKYLVCWRLKAFSL